MKLIIDNNNKKVWATIELTEKTTRVAIRQAMLKTGNALVKEARRAILNDPKTGRIYIINGRPHRSSASGETHANLTQHLLRSLSCNRKGIYQIEFGYGVSSRRNAPRYAKFLEFGTSKMKPRPTLKNALNKEKENIIMIFRQEIRHAFE